MEFVSLPITKGVDLDQPPPASRVRRNLTRHHVPLAAGEPAPNPLTLGPVEVGEPRLPRSRTPSPVVAPLRHADRP